MPHGDSEATPSNLPPHRGVRTTRNRGSINATQRARLGQHLATWSVAHEGPWSAEALQDAFGRPGPLLIDIGIGSGEATCHWAAMAPEANVLAIEVHLPSVARFIDQLEEQQPTNVRLAVTDACALIETIEQGTVSGIRVLFPDPWPKRRHQKRRMIDSSFTASVARALAPGARLEVATDWPGYAADIVRVMTESGAFEEEPLTGRPERPVTTYESRARRAGRVISDQTWARTETG